MDPLSIVSGNISLIAVAQNVYDVAKAYRDTDDEIQIILESLEQRSAIKTDTRRSRETFGMNSKIEDVQKSFQQISALLEEVRIDRGKHAMTRKKKLREAGMIRDETAMLNQR
jgi:hypothetical protein